MLNAFAVEFSYCYCENSEAVTEIVWDETAEGALEQFMRKVREDNPDFEIDPDDPNSWWIGDYQYSLEKIEKVDTIPVEITAQIPAEDYWRMREYAASKAADFTYNSLCDILETRLQEAVDEIAEAAKRANKS